MGAAPSVQYVPYAVPTASSVQTRIQYVDRVVDRTVVKEVAPNAINIKLPKQAPPPPKPVQLGIPCTSGMTCMSDIKSRLQTLLQEVNTIQTNIKDSFQIIMSNQVGYEGETYFKQKVRDYKDQKSMYDRKFQELEASYDRKGGKTRKQTLQEYVILLFYISYFVLTISYALYSSTIVGASAYGSVGFMLAMIFPITASFIYFL